MLNNQASLSLAIFILIKTDLKITAQPVINEHSHGC